MKLHEHQAKSIFADAGIPVPDSRLATTVDEALDAVDEIGYPAAIKAQVHVGGRGKAGGIKIATDREEAEQYAEEILGMDLKGYTVDSVLVEAEGGGGLAGGGPAAQGRAGGRGGRGGGDRRARRGVFPDGVCRSFRPKFPRRCAGCRSGERSPSPRTRR